MENRRDRSNSVLFQPTYAIPTGTLVGTKQTCFGTAKADEEDNQIYTVSTKYTFQSAIHYTPPYTRLCRYIVD